MKVRKVHIHRDLDGKENSRKGENTQSHVNTHNHEFTHNNGVEHKHKHSHQNTKAVLNRLSRASGHLNAVRGMIEEGKDCSEVLIQLSAVIAALNNTGKVILKDHMEHCIVDAVESGDKEAIDNLNRAIDSFIK